MLPELSFTILEITGEEKDLKDFKYLAQGFDPNIFGRLSFNDICLNNFIPLPDYVINGQSQILLEKHRMKAWGISTDSLGASLKQKKGKLIYSFCTGSGIPYPVFEEMKRQFKTLKFSHKVIS
tara:strand:+ start:842 stop:1210 length:369 start_codon:yes stop_codon:yes gene_type:complete